MIDRLNESIKAVKEIFGTDKKMVTNEFIEKCILSETFLLNNLIEYCVKGEMDSEVISEKLRLARVVHYYTKDGILSLVRAYLYEKYIFAKNKDFDKYSMYIDRFTEALRSIGDLLENFSLPDFAKISGNNLVTKIKEKIKNKKNNELVEPEYEEEYIEDELFDDFELKID